MKRACGILLPIASLPSNYGIGSFSGKAYEFIDKLEKAGQSYWQILPIGPTGYGDSPYQSASAFAGNPYFVDLDALVDEGLLTKEDITSFDWGDNSSDIDYAKIWKNRETVLNKAYINFKMSLEEIKNITIKDKYEKAKSDILDDTKEYCLYQAIKNENNGLPWNKWEDNIRLRNPKLLAETKERLRDTTEFYEWVQIEFKKQWKKLRQYAYEHGVEFIGDLPIYVAFDSADAWAHPELFQFDIDRMPEKVAGCPPDYFAPEGQFWGNPLYKWEYHKKTNYAWWMQRMEYVFDLYDYVRVDHFRGFDEYYAIPAKDNNAINGSWMKGPNMEIFDTMKEYFKSRFTTLPIIAEDLGLMTPTVIKMVSDSGFPGMRVLEFAYDSDAENMYLPHNYNRNCVAYTGTHDNDTLQAWIKKLSVNARQYMIRYQGSEHTPDTELHWDAIRTVMASVADTVIIPLQDYLGSGIDTRTNEPSTIGNNWRWRMSEKQFNEHLIWHCNMLAEIYGRKIEKI